MNETAPDILANLVTGQKRGQSLGLYSICSAHPFVLEACVQQAIRDNSPLLIESTSNQVNQYGGYTGMAPVDFRDFVWSMADKNSFPRERVVLGGDHLGPNPWQNEPAAQAMAKSRDLIVGCVQADYQKIHLDASMKCGDDEPDRPLDNVIAANRAADLALVAEETFQAIGSNRAGPSYVIGTEVPVPGGSQEREESLSATTPANVKETIEITKHAFFERGLEAAWPRVMAVVVQPGVEFSDSTLFEYDRQQAVALSQFIRPYDHLVYEAHSTDYQTAAALKRMVEDQFAILKVGPALTFAFREAVFGLAMIEEELLAAKGEVELSRIRERLEEAMLMQPVYWQTHYQGDPERQRFARKYSPSDRSRYYWPVNRVQTSLAKLIKNLESRPPPYPLLSQYLPVQYGHIRDGLIANSPRAIITDKIASVLAEYAYACGFESGSSAD